MNMKIDYVEVLNVLYNIRNSMTFLHSPFELENELWTSFESRHIVNTVKKNSLFLLLVGREESPPASFGTCWYETAPSPLLCG